VTTRKNCVGKRLLYFYATVLWAALRELSVRPILASNSKTEHKKPKFVWTQESPVCHFWKSEVEVTLTGCQNLHENDAYLAAGSGGFGAYCVLGLTSLGLFYCWRLSPLKTGKTATYISAVFAFHLVHCVHLTLICCLCLVSVHVLALEVFL